jgi:hypothetical protein
MIKLVLIVVLGICAISCTIENITNTTTTTTVNKYYYIVGKDTISPPYITAPWIDKDTTIVIGG